MKDDDPAIGITLGSAYNDVGDFQSAADSLEVLIASSPQNPQINSELGRAHFGLQNYSRARIFFRISTELAPLKEMNWGLLGLCYSLDSQAEKSVEYFLKAIELESQPGPFRLQLATVLEQLGRIAEAIEYYRKATENEFNRAFALEQLERLQS